MGMKFTDIEKLRNELNDKKALIDDTIEQCLKELALRFLRKVIKNTPSDTGTLRKGWQVNLNNLKVIKQGTNYSIILQNDAKNEDGIVYSGYVEYGHRDRTHKKWVPGLFIATIAEKELKEIGPKIVDKKFEKILKEKLDL